MSRSPIVRTLARRALAALLCLLLIPSLLGAGQRPTRHAFTIQGAAMEPSLRNNQVVWVDTTIYRHASPQRGDLIVFRATPAGQPDRFFLKRVIALPGETVAVRKRAVYINGHRLREPYVREPAAYSFLAARVPRNDYFVLGDNRNNSLDSHLWKWLARKYIAGKAYLHR